MGVQGEHRMCFESDDPRSDRCRIAATAATTCLQGKIVKDKRYAVYSPLDGQVSS